MSPGQQRAQRELSRICAASDGAFEVEDIHLKNGLMVASISLQIGAIQTKEGGLPLRDREEFILIVPSDFPFERPWLRVTHMRFAGFPHVTWGKSLCLYQSSMEWNPANGLYGFLSRLKDWLARAAISDMDPLEGPLEPPHHNTDMTQPAFVIRADAPCTPGGFWVGFAILEKHPNRIELIGWHDASSGVPESGEFAFAVVLPKPLPMEFPTMGRELFSALEQAGVDRMRMLDALALAANFTKEGNPLHLVLGLPMRRAVDGFPRLHIAIWTMDEKAVASLKNILPKTTDTGEIESIREELGDALLALFEISAIKWCRILEDRTEVIVRRDNLTALKWFRGKRIVILGCGALGSWVAEMIARAAPKSLDLVDNGIVNPGLLARQNYRLDDIGANKAISLCNRLEQIAHGCSFEAHPREAHAFLLENVAKIHEYDLMIDCTASSIFQMKMERDWLKFGKLTPPIISMIIDGIARRFLCVIINRNSDAGMLDAYLSAKFEICSSGSHPRIAEAFYSERSLDAMFQPEPGCSDPTFIGSTADVITLASVALNTAASKLGANVPNVGFAWSAADASGNRDYCCFENPIFNEFATGEYRVRVANRALSKVKSWVRKNNRDKSIDVETGGLLWGVWDDAIQAIWIFDVSGPPPDSEHRHGYFLCGTEGTTIEHQLRAKKYYGSCDFIGLWHTHPNMSAQESATDMASMATLVSATGANQKRSVMLIFGNEDGRSTVGIYIYESRSLIGNGEIVSVGNSQFELEDKIL